MINKCPSCGKTAIGPIKKWFLGFDKVYNCNKCGIELKIKTMPKPMYYLWFIIGIGVLVMLPDLVTKHSFFSTILFKIIIFLIWVASYVFLKIGFVPLIKSSE
jgi:uncharacterized protein (DUF983 family)